MPFHKKLLRKYRKFKKGREIAEEKRLRRQARLEPIRLAIAESKAKRMKLMPKGKGVGLGINLEGGNDYLFGSSKKKRKKGDIGFF